MALPGLRGTEHIGFTVPDLDQAERFFVDVIDRGDVVSAIELKVAGHIGTHATDSDKCYFAHNVFYVDG